MGFHRSTSRPQLLPSWPTLAHLRKRGQVPAGLVFVTDHRQQLRNLIAGGAFALPLPEGADGYLVAGLDVMMFANQTPEGIEAAQVVAGGNPKGFSLLWRGGDFQAVV